MEELLNNKVNYSLTKEELDSFMKKGYIGPFDLYSQEEMNQKVKEMRPKLYNKKNAIHGKDASSGNTDLSNYDRHLDLRFLYDHIFRAEIVDRVNSILGPNLLCWRTEFFPKYPGDEGTDWHQAATFANVTASKTPQIEWPESSLFKGTLTVWTAFTESTIDNGCLQFIPGTHTTMFYDENKQMDYDSNQINNKVKNGVSRGFFGYDYSQLQIDPNWQPDEKNAESMVMRAGQFIIFLSTLMHGSHPHSGKTNDMRLGYAARYVPTEVKVYPYSDALEEFGSRSSLQNYGAVLVSGQNKYNHNDLVYLDDKNNLVRTNKKDLNRNV
jgi:non-haem Fe2+, alpha-ketoglutarate-dependent halogenase